MIDIKSTTSFVLALSFVLGLSAPAMADRYDDPTNINIETTEPLDTSENRAVILQEFA